jgi:hypothetical protein
MVEYTGMVYGWCLGRIIHTSSWLFVCPTQLREYSSANMSRLMPTGVFTTRQLQQGNPVLPWLALSTLPSNLRLMDP